MVRFFVVVAFFAVIFSSSVCFSQTNRFDINPKQSEVKWLGKKVIGSDHYGLINVKSGKLQVDLKGKKIISGDVTIDMKSIVCSDVEDKEWNMKLINHLNSSDFFSTSDFPTAKFMLTSFKKIKRSEYSVSGMITIRENTKKIEFPAAVSFNKEKIEISVRDLVLDRTEFNIKYGSDSFFKNLKDRAISDNFVLNIELVADLY